MPLPEFNKNGDLPQGIYYAKLKEVLNRFGKESTRRKTLALRLERIYQIAVSTGHLARFIVFGSFITEKSHPNDVDAFILMDYDFDFSKVKGEIKLLFDHNLAQSHFGCSVFWVRRCAALDGEDQTIKYWQIKRDGKYRGIIEISGE